MTRFRSPRFRIALHRLGAAIRAFHPVDPSWPLCRSCNQSCTGSYCGSPRCYRCDTSRKLVAR